MAAPVFANFTPSEGSTVVPTGAVGFEVTDADDDILLTQVNAVFTDTGDQEVVFDALSSAFASKYLSQSTRLAITDGFRFSVSRTGGWPSDVTLRATVTDTSSGTSVRNILWTLGAATGPAPVPAPFIAPAFVSGADIGQVERGCGLLAPFRRDGKGDFANSCGIDVIRSSVQRILGVLSMSEHTRGDIPWRPEFGSSLGHLLFLPADPATADLARFRVLEALRVWEPRIEVLDVSVSYDTSAPPGSPAGVTMRITIAYNILGQTRGSGALVPGINQVINLQAA